MNFTLPELPLSFYLSALPVFILTTGSIVLLLQGVTKIASSTKATSIVSYVFLVSALLSCFYQFSASGQLYLGGSYMNTSIVTFSQILVLVIALVTFALFSCTHSCQRFFRGEILSLFFMVLIGMLVMVAAGELISVFIGLELASIGLYALIGYINPNRSSIEGAVKYFILGSFASGFLLFGFALLYAGSGSLEISKIISTLSEHSTHPWIVLGGLLAMVGLGFKLALAPFHLWAPDAYEAAPTGLTGFMATAVKVMTITVMLRFLTPGMQYLGESWGAFFVFTAVLSTIFGNLLALVQSSIKRMLAYSSVAHAGYMAIALCAISASTNALPVSSVLFYLLSYTIASLGTFGIIMWLETESACNLQLDDLAGLSRKYPLSAVALAVFMFSFAGIPPSAGFMGKFFLFASALHEGLYGLVIIGILGAVIALYYYLRLIVKMFMAEPKAGASALNSQRSVVVSTIVASAIALILLMGTILPNPIMQSVKKTARTLTTIAH